MGAGVTVHGLTEVLVQLDTATSKMPGEVGKVLGRAGFQIKKGAQRRWRGMKHLRALYATVNYDVYPTIRGVAMDVGVDKARKQGPLGNVAEFGTVNNPPRPALAPELDIEAPKTEAALDALLGKLLP